MAFSRPTLGALIRDAAASFAAFLPGADATLRRSNLGVVSRVLAGLTHGQYGYLDWQARQLIPDTAEAEYLDRWARIYGLSRKAGTAAAGNVTLSGTNGATLDAGAVLVRGDGASYTTDALATIASGTATVAVTAADGGTAGNADAGAALGLRVAVPGISGNAVVASGGLAGGTADEDDDALRARLLARIQAPPQGGAAADYVAWALAVDGVTRAWCYPQARGAGTVDVAFVVDGRAETGGSIIPTSPEVVAVQAAIDALRPVCDDCLVYAPVAAPLDIEITGLLSDTSEVRAAVEVELAAQILRDAVPGGIVYRSRLMEAVSRATGETSHSMTDPATDVASAAGEIATPGTVTFV